MNVTFRQLRVFAEVARQGSMSAAAAALHLTPQAVSMQIKEIESQVGLPLFDRVGREILLSTAGEYFLVHARRLLADLKQADAAMAHFRHAEDGALTIGIVATAAYFVPRLLARFHDAHPGVDVRLHVAANREQLVAALDAGDVDLTVMGRAPRELAARAEPFAAHPLGIVCAAGHRLLAVGPLPAAALRGQPFIARESGSGTRAAMDAFFAEHPVDVHVTMTMTHNEAIKQAVIAGLGLAFVSLHTTALEVKSGLLQVLDVDGTPLLRSWNLVRLRSKTLSPAAEAFRYFVIERGEAEIARLLDAAPATTARAG